MACIVCYEEEPKLKAASSPCGHTPFCFECISNLSECPVCRQPSTAIRIFDCSDDGSAAAVVEKKRKRGEDDEQAKEEKEGEKATVAAAEVTYFCWEGYPVLDWRALVRSGYNVEKYTTFWTGACYTKFKFDWRKFGAPEIPAALHTQDCLIGPPMRFDFVENGAVFFPSDKDSGFVELCDDIQKYVLAVCGRTVNAVPVTKEPPAIYIEHTDANKGKQWRQKTEVGRPVFSMGLVYEFSSSGRTTYRMFLHGTLNF